MISRELYMSRIRPFIGNELIKVLTGIRRSGKSVMLDLIQRELVASGVNEDQFISINFENMSNAHLCFAEALHEEVTRRVSGISGKAYLFFDEIQEVVGWEKCINSFRVEFDCDIYITGSNAKLLSGELATYLAGRSVEFVIYPFSFGEFSELYHTIFPDADSRTMFTRYLTDGGMPYLSNLRYAEQPSRQYLQDLYNSVVLKDIVKRNSIRDVDLLERIIAYITANVGTTFSAISAVLVVILGVVMFSNGMGLSGFNIGFSGASTEQSVAVVEADDESQTVTIELSPRSYAPITVKKGIPVKWIINADTQNINGCNNEILIPKYNISKQLVPGENVIEFTPTEAGTIPYSCWMGMIRSQITVTD